MTVSINGEVIDIFAGARVRDAVRRYSAAALKQIAAKRKRVVDRFGNPLALTGELSEGQAIFITSTSERSQRSQS